MIYLYVVIGLFFILTIWLIRDIIKLQSKFDTLWKEYSDNFDMRVQLGDAYSEVLRENEKLIEKINELTTNI
jgi:hypothetical protein